jgi:hypothetical protein
MKPITLHRTLAALTVSTLAFALPSCAQQNTKAAPMEAALAQPPARWTQRESPQAEAKVASEFLDMLVLDGSMRTPLLLETAKLAKTDKPAAMNYYITQFLARLQTTKETELSAALFNTEAAAAQGGGGGGAKKVAPPAAIKLMDGVAHFGGKAIHIGEPGSVDWSTPWDRTPARPASVSLHTSATFLPLLNAYGKTGERKYLDRWVAYLDDWSQNDDYFDHLHPLVVPDGIYSQSAGYVLATVRALSNVPKDDLNAIPPRVLAQVFRHFLQDMLPYRVTYIRSNTHNWTPRVELLQIARIFEEFKAAPQYFRAALRRDIEDNAVTQNLRDGTESQQDHWYNPQYLKVADALPVLEAGSLLPGWNEVAADAAWKAELKRHLKARVTWLIHDRSSQNLLPVAWNGGMTRKPEAGTRNASPEAFNDPVNSAILKAVNGNKSADPGYDSEWFPYGGYNIVRGGWGWRDGYGAMFTSPMPGAYGAYRSRSNNNTFGLNAYGQDLLIDDATGHYMYPSSPLRVDGRNQFFHVGVYKVPPPEDHKAYQVNAWWQPANWRWHASENFNLMEGVYSGAWTNPGNAQSTEGPHGTDQSQTDTLPANAGAQGISHQRFAMYVRDAKLWIITDRMRATGAHQYAQQWIIPLRPQGDVRPAALRVPLAFDASKITLDEGAKKIATNEPIGPAVVNNKIKDAPKVNLSLYQFSAMPLEYSAKVEPRGKEYGKFMYYSRDRVQVKWRGSGDQQVVTIAFPRAPGTGPEGDLKSAKQITSGKSGLGFEAITPDGKTVQYLSSQAKDDTLALGTLSVQGEALLLEGDKGMALGASRMTVDGKAIDLPTPDFEFQLNGDGAPRLIPIYRPIAPVEIGPERNVFADQVLVTLSSKTPGVEIRYTTDGEEPTPQSPLYSKPFALTQTATVLARAYRPGVTQNPPQLSGTHATVVSSAHFEKQGLAPGAQASRSGSGLNVNYYEGDWKSLFLDFDDQKPRATGKATKLWDTAIVPNSNPFVAGNGGARVRPYALEYSGFLNMPADGVYTLHAPQEYIWPATAAGYDLRVWLDGKLWYPATTLHAFGTWSIALQKGAHSFRVVFIDYRTNAPRRLNKPNLNTYIWDGTTPDLTISGPGVKEQPIPTEWLLRPTER